MPPFWVGVDSLYHLCMVYYLAEFNMTENFLRRPPSPKKGSAAHKLFFHTSPPLVRKMANDQARTQGGIVHGSASSIVCNRCCQCQCIPPIHPSLDIQRQEISLISDKSRESYNRRRYVSTVIGRRLCRQSRLTAVRPGYLSWHPIANPSTLSERRRTIRAVTPDDSGCDTSRRSANLWLRQTAAAGLAANYGGRIAVLFYSWMIGWRWISPHQPSARCWSVIRARSAWRTHADWRDFATIKSVRAGRGWQLRVVKFYHSVFIPLPKNY